VLVQEDDGDFVVRQRGEPRPVWSAGTRLDPELRGLPNRLVLRRSGELTVHSPTGHQIWSSGTAGRPAERLILGDDGRLALVGAGEVLWSSVVDWPGWAAAGGPHELVPGRSLPAGGTLTSPDGRYRLRQERDGHTVLYRSAEALWLAGSGRPGSGLSLEPDGRLVRREVAGAEVAFGLGLDPAARGARFAVRDGGDAALLDDRDRVLWSSAAAPGALAPPAGDPGAVVPPAGGPGGLEGAEDRLLVVRTGFADPDGWAVVLGEIGAPWPGDQADAIVLVDDPAYAGWPLDRLTAAVRAATGPDAAGPVALAVADTLTCASGDRPLIVADVTGDPANRPFRAVPTTLYSLYANLSVANADWQDYTDRLEDGLLRS
jgi:hypothetical protein